MSGEELDWHAAKVLARFQQINALVLASIQAARDHRDRLDEHRQSEDAEPVERTLTKLSGRLEAWLEQAKFLRAWLLEEGHKIGVLVEKARLGTLEHGFEDVRRLNQELKQKHREVAVVFLEKAGRDIYQRALTLADKLLQSGEIEQTAEFQRFREELELDEFEAILEGNTETVDAASEPTVSVGTAGATAGGVLDEEVREAEPDDLEDIAPDGAHDPL